MKALSGTMMKDNIMLVTGIHYMPFHESNGYGKTAEELEEDGIILVEDLPLIEQSDKIRKHYINIVTKEQWYEYEDTPESDIELLREQLKATQDTLDFLLSNGISNMPTYLGVRIIAGALEYAIIIPKYPQFKDEVDAYLRANDREDLIVSI